MADHRHLQKDVEELLGRIQPGKLLRISRTGEEDLLSTAMAIPTLGERGYTDHASELVRIILDQRDSEGGWDDPWQTVFGLEALEGLLLRGIEVNGTEDAVRSAVRVLRGSPRLASPDHELRLIRALVLAGLATKDPGIIDFGLIRARAVLDSGLPLDETRDTSLHGLLALVDLFAITRDETIQELLEQRSNAVQLENVAVWAPEESVDVISRAGVVLEKAGKREQAEKAYEYAILIEAEALDTISLKHRIELGARLFGDKLPRPLERKGAESREKREEHQPDKPAEVPVHDPSETNSSREIPEVNGSVGVGEDEKAGIASLPAYMEPSERNDSVTAIVIDRGNAEELAETLNAIDSQERPVDEIVLITTKKRNLSEKLLRSGKLTVFLASEYDTEGERWSRGSRLVNGKWVWALVSGVQPRNSVLRTMLAVLKDDTDLVYLADRKGELEQVLAETTSRPSLSSHRVLFRKELLRETGFDPAMRAEPFWKFVLNLREKRWTAVLGGENAMFEGKEATSPDLLENLVRDTYRLLNDIPETDGKTRKQLRLNATLTRRLAFDAFRREGKPLVSIVIPHYNLPEMLLRCIEKIVDHTHNIPFEIIVVDDGSDNTSVDHIDRLEKWGVLYLRNRKNEGFARSCNRGAEEAHGSFLLFLNNDTEVEEGWLDAMLRASQEEDADITGARLLYPDRTIQHAGVAITANGLPSHIYHSGPGNMPQVMRRRYYQVITAACMLVRTCLFRRLEGFDEMFRNSYEDVDFCLRARGEGVRIVYEPEAVVIHHAEQSPGRKDNDDRNTMRYLAQWSGRVVPDVHIYADMDGYRVDKKNGVEVLVPKTSPSHHDTEKRSNAMESVASPPVEKQAEPGNGKTLAQQEESLHDLIARADMMIQNGRFNEAEETLVGGAKRVNGNVRQRAMYWTLLGDARFRQNRSEDAYDCYKRAVTDDPSAERAWIGIATYQLIRDNLDEAEDIFKRIIRLSPNYDRGYMGMGNVCLRSGKFDEAVKHFKEAARLNPSHRPAIVGLVAAAVQSGKMMEARAAVEKYLQIHPEDVEARFHLAGILYGSEKVEEARLQAEKVLEANPEHQGAKQLMEHLQA